VEADGLAPGLGEAVHLAMSGLWFDRMFGLTEFTREKLVAIRQALRAVVEEAAGKKRGASGVGGGVVPAGRRKKGTKAVRNGRTGTRRSVRG
jgi:hypothetical protein